MNKDIIKQLAKGAAVIVLSTVIEDFGRKKRREGTEQVSNSMKRGYNSMKYSFKEGREEEEA